MAVFAEILKMFGGVASVSAILIIPITFVREQAANLTRFGIEITFFPSSIVSQLY